MRIVAVPRHDTVAVARRAVVTAAADHLENDCLDDVALVTSELVTNAVRHGPEGSEIRIEARSDGQRFSVVVVNELGSQRPPEPHLWKVPGPDSLCGRGLGIVRSLAPGVHIEERDDQLMVEAWWRVPR
jgi:anti-sigma regulatory factor (Ser/Thr protein kinase)